jgi:hypothetical protein
MEEAKMLNKKMIQVILDNATYQETTKNQELCEQSQVESAKLVPSISETPA